MRHIIALMIRKKTECNAFSSVYIFSSLWSFCWEEWNWLPWQSNNLGSTGTWLFFWKVCVLQGCVTMCTKERGIVPSFTSPSFACNSNYSKAFELPGCFSENMSCWRLLKPDFKGSSCGRIPHCFLLLTVL